MKKLNVTKERFEKSRYFKKKYGTLKFVSESGRTYKTDKGEVIRFVTEAREYIDDDSIEEETAEEFIIFEDPDIFKKIAEVQKKENKEAQDEINSGEVTPQEVKQAAGSAKDAAINGTSRIAAAAITGAANIMSSKAALGLAAAAGYGNLLNKANDIGQEWADNHEAELKAYGDWIAQNRLGITNAELDKRQADLNAQTAKYAELTRQGKLAYSKMSNLFSPGRWDNTQDEKAWRIANQMKDGKLPEQVIWDYSRKKGDIYKSSAETEKWLKDNGYEIKNGIINRVDPNAVATGAAGAGVTAAASNGIFGLSLATVGWIVAGVAAAAIITPYIYDKVRACAKTWLADIIAEVKFTADGKKYRCFYDLKENKWVLTYANIKWTSYLDNKLDKETIEEFFASNFFRKFLDKCRQTFALLYSTSKNEVVFKTLPEIKDAPKELKDILVKIYDNKGAITKNLFTGNHV